MPHPLHDITGHDVLAGKVIGLSKLPNGTVRRRGTKPLWDVECRICKRLFRDTGSHLTGKVAVKSCGCSKREAAVKNGAKLHAEYKKVERKTIGGHVCLISTAAQRFVGVTKKTFKAWYQKSCEYLDGGRLAVIPDHTLYGHPANYFAFDDLMLIKRRMAGLAPVPKVERYTPIETVTKEISKSYSTVVNRLKEMGKSIAKFKGKKDHTRRKTGTKYIRRTRRAYVANEDFMALKKRPDLRTPVPEIPDHVTRKQAGEILGRSCGSAYSPSTVDTLVREGRLAYVPGTTFFLRTDVESLAEARDKNPPKHGEPWIDPRRKATNQPATPAPTTGANEYYPASGVKWITGMTYVEINRICQPGGPVRYNRPTARRLFVHIGDLMKYLKDRGC
jgi:hypothetical protein